LQAPGEPAAASRRGLLALGELPRVAEAVRRGRILRMGWTGRALNKPGSVLHVVGGYVKRGHQCHPETGERIEQLGGGGEDEGILQKMMTWMMEV
jgi:hypothetical protein